MAERVFCRKPLHGIKVHERVHEVEPVFRGVGDDRGERRLHNLRKRVPHLGRQLHPLGPHVLGRRPQDRADPKQLVHLGRPGEQRAERVELGHDGPHRPRVDRRVVRRRAEEDLGRTVPPRRDILGVGRAGADLPGQPKVGNLAHLALHQDVFRLDVAVEKRVGVHVVQALQDLEHKVPHLGLGQQLLPLLGHLIQVPVQKLKHKVQLVVLPDHLLQLHNVWVVQLFQRLPSIPHHHHSQRQCHRVVVV